MNHTPHINRSRRLPPIRHPQQQQPKQQQWASSWGGTLHGLSVRLFCEDFSDELTSTKKASASISCHGDSSASCQNIDHALPIGNQHHRGGSQQTIPTGSYHNQSIVKLQPTREKVEHSPLELQEKMQRLMTSFPDLWKKYKQELAQQDNPNQPDTVRTVLIDFLHRHENDLNNPTTQTKSTRAEDGSRPSIPNGQPTSTTKPQKSSFMDSLKNSLHVETLRSHGNDSGISRLPKSVQGRSQHSSKDKSSVSKGTSGRTMPLCHSSPYVSHQHDQLEHDLIQQRLARLLGLPSRELWEAFQKELQDQDRPSDPRTIQIVLDEFWNEHDEEILRQERQLQLIGRQQTLQKSVLSNYSLSSSIHSKSFLQGLNTSLHEERGIPDIRPRTSVLPALPPLVKEDMIQRRLTRIRQIPHFLESFHRRAEEYPMLEGQGGGKDNGIRIQTVLETFWKEHEDEILDYEEERKMEVKLQSPMYVELNTTFHEEAYDRGSRPVQNAPRVMSHSHFRPALVPINVSENTVTDRKGFEEPSRRTNNINAYQQEQSFSRRSIRSLKLAMDSLAGEMDDFYHENNVNDKEKNVRIIPEGNPSDEGQRSGKDQLGGIESNESTLRWEKRLELYKHHGDGFSSRSIRSMKVAVESLAGEVDESSTIVKQGEEGEELGHDTTRENSLRRMKSLEVYKRQADGFSSRSIRSMKLAIDGLAGEIGDNEAPLDSSNVQHIWMASPPSTPKHLLAENAKTIWVSVNDREHEIPKPVVEFEITAQEPSSSGFLSMFSSLIASPSTSSSSRSIANKVKKETINTFDADADILSRPSVMSTANEPTEPPSASNTNSLTSSLFRRLNQVSSLLAQDLESEILGMGDTTTAATTLDHSLTGPRTDQNVKDLSTISNSFHAFRASLIRCDPMVEKATRIGSRSDHDDDDATLFQEAAQIAASRRRKSIHDVDTEIDNTAALFTLSTVIVDDAISILHDTNNDPVMTILLRDPIMDVTVHQDVEVGFDCPRDNLGR